MEAVTDDLPAGAQVDDEFVKTGWKSDLLGSEQRRGLHQSLQRL